jgi:hypothetical protein
VFSSIIIGALKMSSINSPLNKLKVAINIMLADIALLSYNLAFSEQVPNAEQVQFMNQLLGLIPAALEANGGPNEVPGSLFNSAVYASIAYEVIAPDGTVLVSGNPTFDASVPNEEQAAVIALLAGFASGVVSPTE